MGGKINLDSTDLMTNAIDSWFGHPINDFMVKSDSSFTIQAVVDMPKPIKIIRSGIATIVFWADGTKTIVKRSADTQDDPYAAFCIALAKKVYKSNSAVKRIIDRNTVVQK